jgi:hypothetical protein
MMTLQRLARTTIIGERSFTLVGRQLMRRPKSVWRNEAAAAGLCAVVMTLVGCGPAPAPAPQPAPPAEVSTPAPPDGQVAQAPAPGDRRSSKTKWVGDIPYDVFYDQPLVVAADNAALAPSISTPASEPRAAEVPAPTTSVSPAETSAAAPTSTGSGPEWPQLVQADVLNDAVTQIRNRLNTNLNTLATYNRNLDAIVTDGVSLAALAAVAEVHPDAVSWKDKARYVRDLGSAISQNAGGTGRGPYEATKLPFEQVVAILNGGPPPDIDAEDNIPFADVADRYEMMKRIKQSFDFLRAEINTQSRFKESPDDIVREASVLASFGGVLSHESYDSADQEMYQNFIREFMQANVEVAKAAASDDFAGFETARNRVQQACDKCHAEYAFGTDSF